MKIVGIFDNCGKLDCTLHPNLKQVVFEEDGKYGMMYENPNNGEIALNYSLGNAKNEAAIENCVEGYLSNMKFPTADLVIEENILEDLKVISDRYAPVFYDRDNFIKQPSFKEVDNEHFRIEEGLEISGKSAALALVTEGEQIFIGSSKYLLEIVDTVYSDSQDESVLGLRAQLLENMEELDEAKEIVQVILGIQTLDYSEIDMYTRELVRLERKIKGSNLVREKLNERWKKNKRKYKFIENPDKINL